MIFNGTNNRGVIYWMDNVLMKSLYQNTLIKNMKINIIIKKIFDF